MFLLSSIDGKKIIQEIPIGVTFNFNIIIKSKIMYIAYEICTVCVVLFLSIMMYKNRILCFFLSHWKTTDPIFVSIIHTL